MKSKIYAFAVLCMGVLMLSSCLKSNTDEVTYYEDTAITSFSLGTLNRYIQTTTKAGVDTVIKTTLNAGSYKFNIDQRNRVIYNPDSLPKGVDATKVVINMTSKNSGALFINKRTKDKMRDSLVYYSSNDSLDFTQPLEIRAFNNSGTAYRSYRVSVNVHKEDANVLKWQSVNGLDHLVASMKGLRALAYDGKMWFMGNDGTGSRVYVGDYDDKQLIWTLALEDVFDADAYRNFVLCCGYPMFLSNGKIYIIKKDGVGYEATAIDAPNISLLLGGAYQSVYAYSKNGQLMESSYMSEVWKEVEMDRDREWLPTEDVNFVSLTSKTNDDVCKLVLLGNRNAQQFAGETLRCRRLRTVKLKRSFFRQDNGIYHYRTIQTHVFEVERRVVGSVDGSADIEFFVATRVQACHCDNENGSCKRMPKNFLHVYYLSFYFVFMLKKIEDQRNPAWRHSLIFNLLCFVVVILD